MSLRMKNLTGSDKVIHPPIDKRLPQHPFRIIMNAPSHSGKTNIILNLIKSDAMYKNYFKVYIFSKTFHDDAAWEAIDINDIYVKEEIDPDFIQSILDKQEEDRKRLKEEDNLKDLQRILIIIDDLMNEVSLSKRDPVSKLFTRGRHYNISTAITTQSVSGLNPHIRKSASHQIYLRNQEEEMLCAGKENAYHIGNKKKFYQMFKYVMECGDYDFLVVNCKKRGVGMFTNSFESVIDYDGDDILEYPIDCDCGECFLCKNPDYEVDEEKVVKINEQFEEEDTSLIKNGGQINREGEKNKFFIAKKDMDEKITSNKTRKNIVKRFNDKDDKFTSQNRVIQIQLQRANQKQKCKNQLKSNLKRQRKTKRRRR